MKNTIEIRCIRENELCLLKDFLYEAIFIPEGVESPSRDIVEKPELRVYTDGFGIKPGDNCLVATHEEKIVGAVWTRIMNDYGHVDEETFHLIGDGILKSDIYRLFASFASL